MNEALECSPNYPHTRLSTVTRSHVRDSDFRLVTKEFKEFDTYVKRVFEESIVESIVGREQKEALLDSSAVSCGRRRALQCANRCTRKSTGCVWTSDL